jgi:hypothetical protein
MEGDGKEGKEGEGTELEASKNGNGDGVLELSRTELNEMIATAVAQATDPLKQELNAAKSELEDSRESTHRAGVKETLRTLQDAGWPPSVLQRAGEIMLADTGSVELTLSKKGDDGEEVEEKLSATDIVLSLLDSAKEAKLELSQRQPRTREQGQGPKPRNDDRPVDEQAKDLLEELRGQAVRLTSVA